MRAEARSTHDDRPDRRVRPRVVGALLLAAVLVACSGPPDPNPADPGTTPPSSSGSVSPATTPPSPSPPAPTPADPPTPAPAPAPAPATPAPAPAPAPPAPPPAPDPGPAGIPPAWLDVDVERLPTQQRTVALTFDAGASDTAVAPILATLAAADAPATFFVTGAFARSFPDAVRAMAAAGHPVGNHSDTHPDFTATTSAAIRSELAVAEAAISRLTGSTTRPLFRFPFGARTPLDIQVVNGEGYVPFRWTVDTLGWKGTSGGVDVGVVRARVVAALQPGAIVLMHVGQNPDDGTTLDADALPGLIEEIRRQGYELVDLRGVVR